MPPISYLKRSSSMYQDQFLTRICTLCSFSFDCDFIIYIYAKLVTTLSHRSEIFLSRTTSASQHGFLPNQSLIMFQHLLEFLPLWKSNLRQLYISRSRSFCSAVFKTKVVSEFSICRLSCRGFRSRCQRTRKISIMIITNQSLD
jgi:hypothetical protein